MKKTIFILFTIVVIVLIVFCLAEVAARIFWSGKPPIPKEPSKYPYHPDDDPVISYILLPDFAYENGFIQTNRQGFRIDRNLSESKSSDEYRIALIGDSLILGTRTKSHKTISSILQNGLETLKFGNGKQIEVLNFGIPGYNIKQYLAVLKKYVVKYEPDVIYLGISIFNDLDGLYIEYLGNGYLTRRTVNTSHGVNYTCNPPGWLEWNSFVLRFLYYARTEARNKDKHSEDTKIEGNVRKYLPASCWEKDDIWEEVKADLKEFKSVAEKIKADLRVFIFPSTAQIAYPELPRKPQELLSSVLKELGIRYHDYYDEYIFQKQKTAKLPFRDTSSHPDDWMYNYLAFSLRDEFVFEILGRPENDFGSVIDIGDKGDVKNLSFGWADREKLGNAGFRWIASARARIVFNNFRKEIKNITIRCFPFDQCTGQKLVLIFNGLEVGSLNIDRVGKLADYTLVLSEPVPLQNFNTLDMVPECVKPAPGDGESMIITPRMISVAVDKITLK